MTKRFASASMRLTVGTLFVFAFLFVVRAFPSTTQVNAQTNYSTQPPEVESGVLISTLLQSRTDEIGIPISLAPTCVLHEDSSVSAEFSQARNQHLEPVDYSAVLRSPQTADIVVQYSGNWTPSAQNAFDHAVSIWERLVTSSVPIIIEAEFANLNANVLGQAGPANFVAADPRLPRLDTWYPVALANAIAGVDLDPDGSDISAQFNQNFDWYLGTDANPPSNQYDFVSVVLHELGHGLGFAGAMRVGLLQGQVVGSYTQFSGLPFVYDHFTVDANGRQLLTYPDLSTQLAAALTSNNVFFEGANAREANDGNRVPLYAPRVWSSGSSYSHLDEDFRGTDNELMTRAIAAGNAVHFPGTVTLGLFADTGWQVSGEPTFNPTTIPLTEGEDAEDALFLPDFVVDVVDPATATYLIQSINSDLINATIDSGNNLDITAGEPGTGTARITIEVTNTFGLSTEGIVDIIIMRNLQLIHLPIAGR